MQRHVPIWATVYTLRNSVATYKLGNSANSSKKIINRSSAFRPRPKTIYTPNNTAPVKIASDWLKAKQFFPNCIAS